MSICSCALADDILHRLHIDAVAFSRVIIHQRLPIGQLRCIADDQIFKTCGAGRVAGNIAFVIHSLAQFFGCEGILLEQIQCILSLGSRTVIHFHRDAFVIGELLFLRFIGERADRRKGDRMP